MAITKKCSKCFQRYPLSKFRYHKETRDNLNSQCRWCEVEYTKQWRLKNFEKRKAQEWRQALKVTHKDMTPELYMKILAKQKGKCAICSEVCPSGRRLAVDHCHTTMKIRGLLCCNCNRMLGLAKDNTKVLSKAIKYLDKSNK